MAGVRGQHRRRWRFYRTAAGARPVEEFLDGLPASDRDEVLAALAVVRRQGLRAARHLRGPLYEVRATGPGGSFRILFATEGQRQQVLLALEGFSKQTQRTPPATLALAEQRLRDWRARGREGVQ